MENQIFTDEQLLDYLDGNLTPVVADSINKALKKDASLASRLAELKRLDDVLSNIQLKSPSGHFVFNVMYDLDKAEAKIRKGGLFIVLAALLTVIIGSYYMVGTALDVSGMQTIDYLSSVKNYMPDQINLKNVNSLALLVISFIALMVFDRAVLKPYFHNRRVHY